MQSDQDEQIWLLMTALLCPVGGLVMLVTGFFRSDLLFIGLGGLSTLVGIGYFIFLIGAILGLVVRILKLPAHLIGWWHNRNVEKPTRTEAEKQHAERDMSMGHFILLCLPTLLVLLQIFAWVFRFQ